MSMMYSAMYRRVLEAVMLLSCMTQIHAGLFGPLYERLTPAELTSYFIQQQIDDPLNPLHSYNAAIAAQQQNKHAQAEKYFSLAADLYPAGDGGLVPVYCSWGDTAAQQLLEQLQAEPDLRDAALAAAIAKADEAGTQYGQVLEIDSQHVPARERKKIVDRLRALLEQRKKQEEEKKEEQKKQNDDDQKQNDQSDQKQKSDSSQQDTQQQNKEDSSNKSSQNDTQQNKNQQKNNEKNAEQNKHDQQKNDQQKNADASRQKQDADQEKSEVGQEQERSQDQKHSSADDDDSSAHTPEKQERQSSDASQQSSSEKSEFEPSSQEKELKDTARALQEEQQKNSLVPAEEGDDAQNQEATQHAQALQASQYDANAEMAKKRGLVLLDKLQQDEAALHKAQLLRQSAVKQRENKGYNQW